MNILSKVKSLRKNELLIGNVDEPFSNNIDTISGDRIRRRVVLKTRGCSVPTCSMCPLPDESVPVNIELNSVNLLNQLRSSLKDDIEDVLTIYTNGNFFSEKEITEDARREMYRLIANRRVSEIVVESLPYFVTEKALDEFAEICPDKKLVIAIGLQSYSERVRQIAINSTCRMSHFEKALEYLKKYGYSAQVFLMFGSPFIREKEMIEDVLYSLKMLRKYPGVISNIVISPLRIAKNTLVQDLYDRGIYLPPSIGALKILLDSIIENNLQENVRIATSILTGADKIDSVRIEANEQLIKHIRKWNVGDESRFSGYHLPVPESEDFLYTDIDERVKNYLESL